MNTTCCIQLVDPWDVLLSFLFFRQWSVNGIGGGVSKFKLIDPSLFQIIVTLLVCNITQSSPQGPSNLHLHTLVSCWLLQENCRATSTRAVACLHGKRWHTMCYLNIIWWTLKPLIYCILLLQHSETPVWVCNRFAQKLEVLFQCFLYKIFSAVAIISELNLKDPDAVPSLANELILQIHIQYSESTVWGFYIPHGC